MPFPIWFLLLYGSGLCVVKVYLLSELSWISLLEALLLLCLNLNVNYINFTSIATKKAAVSAGHEENCFVNYSDIQEKVPGMNFSTVRTPDCEIFSLKIWKIYSWNQKNEIFSNYWTQKKCVHLYLSVSLTVCCSRSPLPRYDFLKFCKNIQNC